MNQELLYGGHYWNYSGATFLYYVPQNILLKKVFSQSQYLLVLCFRANLQEMRLHSSPGVKNEQYFQPAYCNLEKRTTTLMLSMNMHIEFCITGIKVMIKKLYTVVQTE